VSIGSDLESVEINRIEEFVDCDRGLLSEAKCRYKSVDEYNNDGKANLIVDSHRASMRIYVL
jgi:hypothetical protein